MRKRFDDCDYGSPGEYLIEIMNKEFNDSFIEAGKAAFIACVYTLIIYILYSLFGNSYIVIQ